LSFAQVVWARASWLVGGDAVLAGRTSEPDCAADTLVPVAVDSESAADTEALVSLILVPAGTSGRLGNLLWRHVVTVEFLCSVHLVKVDRHEACIWFDVGQGAGTIVVCALLIVIVSAHVVESASNEAWRLHILGWEVIQIDILFLVDVVSLGL